MSDEKQKPESSGSGSFRGYKVEAKVENFVPHRPILIEHRYDGKVVLDTVWRQVSFPLAKYGVPQDAREAEHFVLSYSSAMALAWMLVAQNPHTSILVRVVPYKINFTHETWPDGEPEEVGFGKWYGKRLADLGKELEEREEAKADKDTSG